MAEMHIFCQKST